MILKLQNYIYILLSLSGIVHLLQESLLTGESGRVHFQFLRHTEFLRVGASVLFQEGKTRGIGEIKELIPVSRENVWKKDERTPSPSRSLRKPST